MAYSQKGNLMDTVDIEETLKNKTVDTLMLISVFGKGAYRHRAYKELLKHQLICCPEEFGDDFTTNLDLIF
jgi:hypothetical protein